VKYGPCIGGYTKA